MIKTKLFALLIGFLFTSLLYAQETESNTESSSVTETFTVYGNCGMCEKTIETSLNDITSISKGDWNKETDLMTVVYDSTRINLDSIKQKIADVGYDSDSHRAKDAVYNNLPGCCQYDRPKK